MRRRKCRAKLACLAKQSASDNVLAMMAGQGLIPFRVDLLGSAELLCSAGPTLDFELKQNRLKAN
jgi:hypothetical protein